MRDLNDLPFAYFVAIQSFEDELIAAFENIHKVAVKIKEDLDMRLPALLAALDRVDAELAERAA